MGQTCPFTIVGSVIDAPLFGQLRFRQACKIVVAEDGRIKSIGEDAVEEGRILRLSPDEFLIPGFIDLHCHAPQFPNCGLGTEVGLLEWLHKYTFPEESKYSDIRYAREKYAECVQASVSHGTTCCLYFATVHKDSTQELCKIVNNVGQRAYVGKVCMEHNCPEHYRDVSVELAVLENEDIISFVENMQTTTVYPIVTPRFAPVCSMAMMQQLSELASKKSLLIQSHLSENVGEVEWMKELFPGMTYAQVYDAAGLLTDKTIMAHGIYLSDPELELLKERGTAIAHCPISNYAINSGIMNVRRVINKGVKCGLGSDVSGGWTCSMLEVMRCALIASRSIQLIRSEDACHGKAFNKPLSVAEVYFLATKGAAECISRSDLGSFEVGSAFDAIKIDCSLGRLKSTLSASDSLSDRFHRFFFTGDDRNMSCIYVNGQTILEK